MNDKRVLAHWPGPFLTTQRRYARSQKACRFLNWALGYPHQSNAPAAAPKSPEPSEGPRKGKRPRTPLFERKVETFSHRDHRPGHLFKPDAYHPVDGPPAKTLWPMRGFASSWPRDGREELKSSGSAQQLRALLGAAGWALGTHRPRRCYLLIRPQMLSADGATDGSTVCGVGHGWAGGWSASRT